MKVRTREEIRKEFIDALDEKWNVRSPVMEAMIEVGIQSVMTHQSICLEYLQEKGLA